MKTECKRFKTEESKEYALSLLHLAKNYHITYLVVMLFYDLGDFMGQVSQIWDYTVCIGQYDILTNVNGFALREQDLS